MTFAQRLQLRQLHDVGALDRATAKGPYDLDICNPMVIGKLRDLGLVDSRTMRPKGGSQFTAYWLTPNGIVAARELVSE